MICEIQNKYGIKINATTIQNELNTAHDARFLPEQVVASVKAMRKTFDERGLNKVKVLGPETASCDGVAYKMVEALKADAQAWKDLDGLCTHSYNMAITDRMVDMIKGAGKEYWQTESSVPGPEEAGDVKRASMLAHTALSDLNHYVTYWIHFISIIGHDPRDNGARLGRFHKDRDGDDWLVVHYKYYYMKQLAKAFDPGAKVRRVITGKGRTMTWTYGKKPKIAAAVAQNKDGSWTLAVSNHTLEPEMIGPGKFNLDNSGRPSESFEVTFEVEELAQTDTMQFNVVRSSASVTGRSEKPAIMKNGKLTVTIDPLELVTLRSVK